MNHYIKTTSLFFFIIAALHAKENVNSTHRLGPVHPTQVLADLNGFVAADHNLRDH